MKLGSLTALAFGAFTVAAYSSGGDGVEPNLGQAHADLDAEG